MRFVLALLIVACCVQPADAGHRALVARSGIHPRNVGSHEGVGVSTTGYIAARNSACYWGRRTPLSVQYSKRGNLYYAVVRYK